MIFLFLKKTGHYVSKRSIHLQTHSIYATFSGFNFYNKPLFFHLPIYFLSLTPRTFFLTCDFRLLFFQAKKKKNLGDISFTLEATFIVLVIICFETFVVVMGTSRNIKMNGLFQCFRGKTWSEFLFPSPFQRYRLYRDFFIFLGGTRPLSLPFSLIHRLGLYAGM